MKKAISFMLAAVLALGLSGAPAFAQIGSNVATVQLSMTIAPSLTLTATPGNVSFTYANGSATASGPIQITTTYNLPNSPQESLAVMAYFSNASAALVGANNSISAANVLASANGGAALPCNQDHTNQGPIWVPGATCFVNSANTVFGSGTEGDSLLLSLQNVSSMPDTYSGVLNISAYAQ